MKGGYNTSASSFIYDKLRLAGCAVSNVFLFCFLDPGTKLGLIHSKYEFIFCHGAYGQYPV